MKKFQFKGIILILIIAAILLLVEVLSCSENYAMPIARLTDSETYLTHMDGPGWINPLIEKVSTQDDSKVLLVGDSVCRQLFIDLADVNDEVCVAPAIAPFTMAGQYVLTRLYLDNHPDATDVYLMMVPAGRGTENFNIDYAYQYVVMPLVETDTLNYLDKNTIDELEYIFGKWFMKKGVVERIDASGLNRKLYLNYIKEHGKNDWEHTEEESVYVNYLKKIYDLCAERSVNLYFLSCPIPDMEQYHEIVDVETAGLFRDTGLDQMFPGYLASVRYYPEDHFYDGVHLGGIWETRDECNKVIVEMYSESGLLEYLKFE